MTVQRRGELLDRILDPVLEVLLDELPVNDAGEAEDDVEDTDTNQEENTDDDQDQPPVAEVELFWIHFFF